MSDIAIRVEHLGKRYYIGRRQSSYRTLRDVIADAVTSPFRKTAGLLRGQATSAAALDQEMWALADVSFEVERGEVLGIIGRNGAGKSTLLKILSRITRPTIGRAEIRGRVGSLLEVGTGFHPELTGRDNIYLNGAIIGMRRKEIQRKFDEIVAFSEVEKFIDTPVKHYSSGMYLRLAFAVAAHLEPEILIVDEVLAVGDAEFQKKCLGKMQEVGNSGRTILFVSHNLIAVRSLCARCVLLDSGKVQKFSDTDSVVTAYFSVASSNHMPIKLRKDRVGNGKLLVSDMGIHGETGTKDGLVCSGERTHFDIYYENRTGEREKNIQVVLGIYDSYGRGVASLGNKFVRTPLDAAPREGVFRCTVDKLPLTPGKYYINVFVAKNGEYFDWIQQALSLTVEDGDFFKSGQKADHHAGGVFIEHAWATVS